MPFAAAIRLALAAEGPGFQLFSSFPLVLAKAGTQYTKS
jgi:hypothetical protein